jgi:3-oxoacyl-[acyl-carrier protein] reductase
MSLSLEGKVAVVTGGSRGIGAAIVVRLAKDGANVAFSYSNSKERRRSAQVEAFGRKAFAYKADQAVASQVQAFIKMAHETFGRIDLLVNSAGVFVTGVVGDPKADVEALDRQLDVNVKGGPSCRAVDSGRRSHHFDRHHRCGPVGA